MCVCACVRAYVHVLSKTHMVEGWWKTNYWLQVKGRPGRVVNMLVSMHCSIIALNHPLPMLHCSTVFGQDGAACSSCLSGLNDLTVSSLRGTRTWAAGTSKVTTFFSTEPNKKSRQVKSIEFDTSLDLNLHKGKECSWPYRFFLTQMRLQGHWDGLRRNKWVPVISSWKQTSVWVVQSCKLCTALYEENVYMNKVTFC